MNSTGIFLTELCAFTLFHLFSVWFLCNLHCGFLYFFHTTLSVRTSSFLLKFSNSTFFPNKEKNDKVVQLGKSVSFAYLTISCHNIMQKIIEFVSFFLSPWTTFCGKRRKYYLVH